MTANTKRRVHIESGKSMNFANVHLMLPGIRLLLSTH